MRVVVGSDHAGFEMKQNVLAHVRALGHQVIDVGTDSEASVDYPDFAEAVGMAVLNKEADRGILICGSGVGAVVAVNKIPDNMNVLVLGSRVIGTQLAYDLVGVYLGAEFSNEERHVRRLAKVQKLEGKFR
jgi:ribose 5-phosphate isomerase RpiB